MRPDGTPPPPLPPPLNALMPLGAGGTVSALQVAPRRQQEREDGCLVST